MSKVKVKPEDYIIGDSRKGKQWAKIITGIDSTQSNGYAFQGEFLPKNGQSELAPGTIILTVGHRGSWKNGCLEAEILKVTTNEDHLEVVENYTDYRNEVIDIRDKFLELLKAPAPNPLSEYTNEQLIKELQSRGIDLAQ